MSSGYQDALDYLTTLASLNRMLHDPSMKKFLAMLDDGQERTVGDLIAFMNAYNLRFGPAKSDRQVADLHPARPDPRGNPRRGRHRAGRAVPAWTGAARVSVGRETGIQGDELGPARGPFSRPMIWPLRMVIGLGPAKSAGEPLRGTRRSFLAG